MRRFWRGALRRWRLGGREIWAGLSPLARQSVAAGLLLAFFLASGQLLSYRTADWVQQKISYALGSDYDFAAAAVGTERWGKVQAIDAEVALGLTQPAAPWQMAFPVDGVLTRPFGWWTRAGKPVLHHTVLIAAPTGSPVNAALTGYVEAVGAGKQPEVILAGHGVTVDYQGLGQVYVRTGQQVRQNQVIGTLGGGGLRFAVRVGGHSVDPLQPLFFQGWQVN